MWSITIEILAVTSGLLGAWYVAEDSKHAAGWGFIAFLASNAAWIAFACIHGLIGLLVQQVGFTALSVRGIWKKLVRPRLPMFMKVYRSSRPYHSTTRSARIAWRAAR